MPDVILFRPKIGLDIKRVTIFLPLALLRVASTVCADFDVTVIDEQIDGDWRETLRRALRARPLCLGITAMTGTQIIGGLEACDIARQEAPEIPTVWGGTHPTLLPEQTLSDPLVDVVVPGEGEFVFRDLVRALGKKAPLDGVDGIFFKREGGVVRTRPAPPPELDELPRMPYHLVPVEEYVGNQTNYPARIQRALPVDGSRGCPFRCSYCSEPMTSQRKYRMVAAGRMYDDMQFLVDTYRLQAITVFDDEFLINKKWSNEIAELIGGKFQWWCQARMASLLRYDLERLERNGMCAVQPGIESGSNRVLKFIKKDETVDEYVEANLRLARTGITPLYNFMMGFPTETRDEVIESVDLALRLIEDNPRAEIAGFNIFTPYPGTELYRIGIAHGFRTPGDLRGWSKFHRQQRSTPWIQEGLNFYLDLMLTSKLLDGRRVRRVVDTMYPWLPLSGALLGGVGRYMRRRYRRHRFGSGLSSATLRFVLEKWLNW